MPNIQTVTIPNQLNKKSISKYIDQLLLDGINHQRLLKSNEAKYCYQQVLMLSAEHPDAMHFLGVIYHQQKEHEKALTLIDQSLKQKPHNAEAYVNRGVVHQSLGRSYESLQDYETAIKISPNLIEAYSNRGKVLELLERYDESLECLGEVLKINPESIHVYLNYGNVYHKQKKFSEALESYEKALALLPEFPEAHYNKGVVLQELCLFEKALESYEIAIRLNPHYAEAFSNRGNVLQVLGKSQESLQSYDQALKINPRFVEALSNRGNVLHALNRSQEALKSFDLALNIRPNYTEAYVNKGAVLQEIDCLEDALSTFDKALSLNENSCEAYINLAIVHKELKQWNQSSKSLENAIRSNPKNAKAHFIKAMLQLLMGKLEEGFENYEWRWLTEDFTSPRRNFAQPLWTGGEIQYKTLLIHSEQGHGDTIQFCRYLFMLKTFNAKVIFEVEPKMISLLKSNLEGVCEIVPRGKPLPDFDVHCPLMSLPYVLKTNKNNIPNWGSYLSADETRVSQWRKKLGTEQFKIGIHWQGRPSKIDLGRSFSVLYFKELSEIQNIRLISLQKNTGVEQIDKLPKGLNVEILEGGFDDGQDAFIDTAAVMKCMDLVITSDTSIAHLSGSLGVPTWVVLKWVPDWRWFLDRNDSPWYPSMRLFRQKKKNDWQSAFIEIKIELKKIVFNE
jgi:tetratricopeptide (TPR) repeat protein